MTLLNDILDLSKVEAGKVVLAPTAFDPARLVEEIASLFVAPAQRKQLRISALWRGPLYRYLADPVRLRQMLINLVSNAIKFTEAGEVRIEGGVEPAANSESGAGDDPVRLNFSVTDTGIGIPANKIDLLFRPFSQTDGSTTRKYGGTGLGLSIVRNLAQLMGGDSGVESVPGRGSRFWFSIQASPIHPGGNNRQGMPGQDEGHCPRLPALTGRVLVVEDIQANRKVIEALLHRQGLHWESVDNGQAAAARLNAPGPTIDLVLMDCLMPVMDGYEATSVIRRQEIEQGWPRVPIVALTASIFQVDRERCLQVGMDDFLAKPVQVAELSRMLAKWLCPGDRSGSTMTLCTPPASPQAVPVSEASALLRLHELEGLLRDNKFSALKLFKENRPELAAAITEPGLAELERWLDAFDFIAALDYVRELIRQHERTREILP